jgi:hypothetical protein
MYSLQDWIFTLPQGLNGCSFLYKYLIQYWRWTTRAPGHLANWRLDLICFIQGCYPRASSIVEMLMACAIWCIKFCTWFCNSLLTNSISKVVYRHGSMNGQKKNSLCKKRITSHIGIYPSNYRSAKCIPLSQYLWLYRKGVCCWDLAKYKYIQIFVMCPHTSGCELLLKNIFSFVLYNQRFGRSVHMFRNRSYKHNKMWKCVLNVLVKYGLKTITFI